MKFKSYLIYLLEGSAISAIYDENDINKASITYKRGKGVKFVILLDSPGELNTLEEI